MNDKIIKLGVDPQPGRSSLHIAGSSARFAHADLVIDCDGRVIKDRHGMGNRMATEDELAAAVTVEVEE